MTERGYSVSEAARRTGHSDSTIRRLVNKGILEQIPGSGPTRITTSSVDAERQRALERLGAVEPGAETPSDARVEALEAKVVELSGALSDLTAAHSVLLDTFRRLSSGGVPNN
jgi:hypothetical protein